MKITRRTEGLSMNTLKRRLPELKWVKFASKIDYRCSMIDVPCDY